MKEFIPDRLCMAAVTPCVCEKAEAGDCSQLLGGSNASLSLSRYGDRRMTFLPTCVLVRGQELLLLGMKGSHPSHRKNSRPPTFTRRKPECYFPKTVPVQGHTLLPLSGSCIFPTSHSMPPCSRAHFILKQTGLSLSNTALFSWVTFSLQDSVSLLAMVV